MARIRVGISGWRYPGWRGGRFYPGDLTQKRELEFSSRQFDSIELNGSFYSLQTPTSYRRWRKETPSDFLFSVKGSRFITHMKRLKDCRTPLANFLASGVLALEEKLGPFLWQFPSNFTYDLDRLDAFFHMLPRNTDAASVLARSHDSRLKATACLEASRNRRLRHAIEIRHPSFECPDFIRQLRKHRIALVIADTGGKFPYLEDLTADFVYIRLHGPKELYSSGYDDAALDHWATRIRLWHSGRQPGDARTVAPRTCARKSGRDVFVYFDNDAKVDAPHDARRLTERLR